MTVLAFDVYGTLIDTAGVTGRLSDLVGDRAVEFSTQWRLKQLEYSWRYGLMDEYRDFRICTRQALDWTADQLGCEISDGDKDGLMDIYLELPPFDDVIAGLQRLKALGVGMHAFSNGVPEDLELLIHNSGLEDLLDGIVSVHDLKTFKPDPALYHYFAEKSGADLSSCWLVSSNGFDVCGAVAAGMKAFWLQRNPAIRFDHWEFQPTHVVVNFDEIADILSRGITRE